VPDGFVRDLVNLDPCEGGPLALRIGYEKVYDGTAVRGVLSLGSKVLIADGESLVEYDTVTDSHRGLRAIAGAGAFAGAVLDEVLYFCTENECLQYDGTTVRQWGVQDVMGQPAVTPTAGGALAAGYHQVAMTWTNAYGEEGGTDKPLIVYAAAGDKLVITVPTVPAGHTANVYVGYQESSTLYLQATATTAGAVEVTKVRDDTARCATILLRAPSPGQYMTAHNACLVLARDKVAQLTVPMQRHLVSRTSGFFQYGADIGMVMSAGDLYVSADKCYAIANPETSGAQQRTVLEYPAAVGTGVELPDGRGAFMTRYGQAFVGPGGVDTPNRASYAPTVAERGAAGVVDNNGNQMVVTTLRGANKPNPLAVTDYFIGEIVIP
jgi:hypothetical protein